MPKSKSRFKKTQHTGIRKDLNNNSYVANITFQGRRKTKTFKRLNDAINWRRTFDPNSSEFLNDMKFSEAWDRFKKEHFSSQATSTVAYYLRKESKFIYLHKFRMNQINPNTISNFLEHLKDETAKCNETRRIHFNQELKILGTFFRWYEEVIDYKFKCPIIRRHKKQGQVKPKQFKHKKMEYKELKLFLNYLQENSEYWYDFACTHLFCAARVQEIGGLQIDSFDFLNKEITIKDVAVWGNDKKFIELKSMPKNGEARSVYLNPILEVILTRRIKEAKSNFVFSKNGEPHSYREIQHHYNKALKGAGLHPKYSGTHFLRHTMASITRHVTGSLEATQAITGHRDQAMVQHYASMSSEVNKNAQTKVLEFLKL